MVLGLYFLLWLTGYNKQGWAENGKEKLIGIRLL